MSSLYINKVQNDIKNFVDKKSPEFQAAEDAAKSMNDKYNLASTPKIITEEQKKSSAHKS